MTFCRLKLRGVASVFLLAAAIAPASSLRAQTLAEQTRALAQPPGPSRIISTNPFLPLFGYFSAEYEQRIKDNVAIGVSGSHVRLDDFYTNLDVKMRLYPNDRALEGLGLATSLGVAWLRRSDGDEACDLFGCTPLPPAKAFTTPAFAIEADYQWLLGRSRSTAITVGFGAKRYLGGSRADFEGIERIVPTGRLSIGYGF